MEPTTVISLATLGMRMLGSSSSPFSHIISNQLRILQSLGELTDQLFEISNAMHSIESRLAGTPQAAEVFETSAEVKTILMKMDDQYKIIDRKIQISEEIDFDETLRDLANLVEEILDLLRHVHSLLDSEDDKNTLLYSVTVIDAAVTTAVVHCLYPDALVEVLLAKGAKLNGVSLDSFLDMDVVQVELFDRLSAVYSLGRSIVLKQQIGLKDRIHEFGPKLITTSSKEESLETWNLLISRHLGPNPLVTEPGRIYPLGHELILRVTRTLPLGPDRVLGHLYDLYLFFQRFELMSSGQLIDLGWQRKEIGYTSRGSLEDALRKNKIFPYAPEVVDIASGPPHLSPLQIDGVSEALEDLTKDADGSIPSGFQLKNQEIRDLASSFFYKSVLYHTMSVRINELQRFR